MNETTKTKLNGDYILLERLLDLAGHLSIVHNDKTLSALFCKLTKYVDSKLELSETAGDVVDMYFVVEQKL